ncbi:Proline--tRNA ligase [Planctomycetes bacterium Pan216]|uniref:Proline--tRNA ligase n=1 Tax=Kolteria novifilia TaxID=2527975 RepID=A0A518AY19_9BACT|nr:Proline--tRNA ligase [Planctomycetes bacterium Pan216]
MNAEQFLIEQGVDYEVVAHRPTFSAQEMADALHQPGDKIAKTVLLRVDGVYVVAILRATHYVDLEEVRIAMAARDVHLATEAEFHKLFPDCEFGAVPPFGSLYGLHTLVDEALAFDKDLYFEGNRHDEAIHMYYADFARLEAPTIAAFAHHL